jgi:RNA polymerase sigma factor (sigma-70 family)
VSRDNRHTPGLKTLIRAAREGDETAWEAIVDRFSGLVWATTRAHRLAPAEAADVTQTTWLRLVENLDRIHDPDRLGAWLATTARRECLRHIRLRGRELPTGEETLFEAPSEDRTEERLVIRERNAALRQAFAGISERCKALLRLVAAPEPLSYQEIAAALGMPIGAIGPTRARCLDQLRRTPEVAGLQIG